MPGWGHRTLGLAFYVQVDDIQQSLKLLLDAGAQTQRAVSDVGGGKLIATVQDADGNVTGLIQSP
jgi:predicted enzyme related to lactoylglutathione lyase